MTFENFLKTDEKDRLALIIDTIQEMISTNFDLTLFMQTICDRMCVLTNADGATIEMLEDDFMVYRSASKSLSGFLGIKLNKNGSLSGLCVSEQKILYSPDTEIDNRVDRVATRKVNARSMICVPLFETSKAVGVLKVISSHIDAFLKSDIEVLQLLSFALGVELRKQILYHEKEQILREYEKSIEQLKTEVSRRQVLEIELMKLIDHDVLTGLLSRRALSTRMDEWINRVYRQEGEFAVYYLDLDKFKGINDNYGHEVGDKVLQEFGNRLKSGVREYDLVARLGGDEFVVAAWLVNSAEFAIRVAQQILLQLEAPFLYNKIEIKMKTSIGIALWNPSLDVEDLIKKADQSMYEAKSVGFNRIAIDGIVVM